MEKEKILPEDYLKLKKVTGICAYKDSVVWTISTPDPVERGYKSHIVMRKNGTNQQFTNGSKSDYSPKFSRDGKYLYFLSTRTGKPQVMAMDLVFGGEARQLTNMPNGVVEFEVSPDGENLVFITKLNEEELSDLESTKETPNTKYDVEKKEAERAEKERVRTDPMIIENLVYRQGTSYDDGRKNLIFVQKMDDKPKLLSKLFTHHGGVQWISNTAIVATSKRDEPIDLNFNVGIFRFDVDKDAQEGTLLHNYRAWGIGSLKASPDGDKVAFVGLHEGSIAGQIGVLYVLNTVSGEVTEFGDLDRSVAQWEWKDNLSLLLVVNDKGYADIRELNVSSGEIKTLYRGTESVSMASISESGIYFIGTSPLHPSAVWKVDDEPKLVDEPNKEYLESHLVVEPQEMWFEAKDGLKFQGWFFKAPNSEGEQKPPLALHIHGGPHVMWNNAGTMWHEWQCFLSAGYSVLATNPRGSDGYGEDFVKILVGKWGLDDAQDVLTAVDTIADKVDTDRLYILGGSYAGFQTANIISRDHRFKAAVAQRGVYDNVTFPLTTDIPLWGIAEWEGDGWDRLQYIWENSPVGRAKEIKTPLLIIAAENDFRVPISQSEELFAALKLQDKEAVFVRYPRDGHELSRSGEPLHAIDRIERMIDWFERH